MDWFDILIFRLIIIIIQSNSIITVLPQTIWGKENK